MVDKARILFRGPDWSHHEAQDFRSTIDPQLYTLALTHAQGVFASLPSNTELDEEGMAEMITKTVASLSEGKSGKERKKLKAALMRSMRHAVSGEKVS